MKKNNLNIVKKLDIITKRVGLTADEKRSVISLLRKKAKEEDVGTGVFVDKMYTNILKCKTCKEQVLTGAILEVYDLQDISHYTSLEIFHKYFPKGILTKSAKKFLSNLSRKPKKNFFSPATA